MKNSLNLLAVDIGAGSGRGIIGRYNHGRLSIEEIYRYPNEPVYVNSHMYWDILRIFHEVKKTIKLAYSHNIKSMAIDTWGVDFGLLSSTGEMIGNPYHYRDEHTNGMMEKAFNLISKDEIFKRTGIQFMNINTLYQLLAVKERNSTLLEEADTFLMIPDLLNYFLTGKKSIEYTNASTTQLLNIKTGKWDEEIIKSTGLPGKLFGEIVKPGNVLGKLLNDIADEVGIKDIQVISTASHDTASAVVAIPVETEKFAYISCGTWSLVGTEIDKPINTEKALKYNFTNERGFEDKIRFLKNVDGLWLLQQCKKEWEFEDSSISYDRLIEESNNTLEHRFFIDPDAEVFFTAGHMPSKIIKYCSDTGQGLPRTRGEIVRCILESLALKYRYVIDMLQEVIGYEIEEVYMIGGGIKNSELCQYTANATGKLVKAGPVEATAIGNLMVQLKALREVGSLNQIREIVKNSFYIKKYISQNRQNWEEAYERFKEVLEN